MPLIAGLDIGQTSDPTAFAVLDQTLLPTSNTYQVRYLERFHLGTSYVDIVARVAAYYRGPLRGTVLAVDQTGVGRPVVDLLRVQELDALLTPITITAGHEASQTEDGDYHVPKKDLVGALQVVLQAKRLKIARTLAEAGTLTKELTNFRVKVTQAANETFGAWRDGEHDDLVLAVAMAVWAGEHLFTGEWDTSPPSGTDPATMISRAPPGVSMTDVNNGRDTDHGGSFFGDAGFGGSIWERGP